MFFWVDPRKEQLVHTGDIYSRLCARHSQDSFRVWEACQVRRIRFALANFSPHGAKDATCVFDRKEQSID